MNKKIYSYGRQTIDNDDIEAVVEVLRSDWLTQGPIVGQFERALCERLGARYATVVSNGTAGLHLAGIVLGWKEGDLVLTSPMTFLATANSIVYSGATPDFVDIDKTSYCIDPEKLEDKIKACRRKKKKVKAVIGVDYAGHPCDWRAIKSLGTKYDFQLVDDACHALGGMIKRKSLASCEYADAVISSFHPVKHITTGEGGAVFTHSRDLDAKLKICRSHGSVRDPRVMEKDEGPWYYEMHNIGFNYRITDFQCALGVSQLTKLKKFLDRRRSIAHFYDHVFESDRRLIIPEVDGSVVHAYHLYPLQVRFEDLSISRKVFFKRLSRKNIHCQVHYCPVHLQPYYKKRFGFKEGDYPIAERFYSREVSIPMHPALKRGDLTYIASAIIDSL